MRVIRCDICGEVYLPYAKIHGEGENEGEVYEGNGFSFLVIGKDGRKRPTFTAELCSRCNLELRNFLKEMGINTSKLIKDDAET